jgi:hypothetical protein
MWLDSISKDDETDRSFYVHKETKQFKLLLSSFESMFSKFDVEMLWGPQCRLW